MKNVTAILELKSITKQFPGVKAIDNVSLCLRKGDVLGLVGENGAGKSTLIKILSGAYRKEQGDILINGECVNISSPIDALRAGIAVIYQELSLVRQLNVVENLYLGRLIKNKAGFVDWRKMINETKIIFQKYKIDIPLDVPVRELSVAQCQLVEILRAISWGARIIIMDEPTSSLTNTEVEMLFGIIKELHSNEITVIYISHKIGELFRICNRVSVLKDGKNSGEFDINAITPDDIVSSMIGRKLETYYPNRASNKYNEELLRVENLNLDARVKNVSFSVHRGEILGFSGLVGSGRTEIMKSIFKAEHTATGSIYIEGKRIRIRNPKEAIKAGIAFVTEDRRYEGLVLVAPCCHNITLANFNSIKGKLGFIKIKKERELAKEHIYKLKIKTPNELSVVSELSGGNQQKVVVAKWLNTEAKIFIFDEPTRGIDVGAKSEIYQLMVDIANQGKAVIMVSSELPEVLGVCDRILVVCHGQISGEFNKEEATEQRIMYASLRGIDYE